MRTIQKTRLALPLVLMAATQLGACVSMKSYPDPVFRKASYKDITAVAAATPVRVEVQFQREGSPKPAADLRLRSFVEKTLLTSGVFKPDQQSTALLRVVVNNVGDKGAAMSVGIVTGLTFGLSGGMVTDEYQFNIAYTDAAGVKQDSFYRHALHTAVGGADLPQGYAPLSPADAYGKVVEDAVLNFVQQHQVDQLAAP